jgi:phosphatidylserine decarboxylase
MYKVGWFFTLGIGILSFLFLLFHWYIASGVSVFFMFFFIYFFRDPKRAIVKDKKAIVSPADGKVVFLDSPSFGKDKLKKISIFMSLFDVHINRAAFEGEVKRIEYKKGRFFPAYKKKASMLNESNNILFSSPEGEEFTIVQIAGILARRIICTLKPGQLVKKGERIGMICFGSKVELYLPEKVNLMPLLGKKVKAGETILGYWP